MAVPKHTPCAKGQVMNRPVISAATPRVLTHELMDLGLDPKAIATAVQIFRSMSAESSDPVTVRIEVGRRGPCLNGRD